MPGAEYKLSVWFNMVSIEGGTAVGDAESEGERLAITWVLHNWCTSNSQLAVVSNVCRRWSEIASATVASEDGAAPAPAPGLVSAQVLAQTPGAWYPEFEIQFYSNVTASNAGGLYGKMSVPLKKDIG